MRPYLVNKGLKIFIIAVFAVVVLGSGVMGLWNWLVPVLFGGPRVNFLQALALFVLAKLLFGGLRGFAGPHRHWEGRMFERWERMTPEERQQFRETLRGRCGYGRNDGGKSAGT